MKVSIIVPVYNVEDYVLECLNSVKDLSIEYEIIVVNDGSTDNSLAKIREFESGFKGQIIVVDKENGGQSSARNIGIEEASGNYLFFLDSDDFIDKSKFEKFVEAVESDGVDIGFADYYYKKGEDLYLNKETEYRRKLANRYNNIYTGIDYGNMFFDTRNNFISSEAAFTLIKRQFVVDNNIVFKQGIYHEDTLFTLMCLLHANKVRYYDIPFYIYRIREGSTMTTINPLLIDKKLKDKNTIARVLFELKGKMNLNSMFLDTLIVDLLLVSVMHFKKKGKEINDIISACNNITYKSKIRVLLYRFLSLWYEEN